VLILSYQISMTALEQNIVFYFGDMQKQDLDAISAMFHKQSIAKGTYFLETGKTCDKLSFIQSGIMRIFVNNDGKEITQWISTAGYFITDLSSLIFESPARWTIQALTDTELWTINRADYTQIGKIVPSWHQLEKLFVAKCFTMLENRIFSHLSMTSEERYIHFFEHHKDLFNQVPLQYIASMLGMTPETFSRIRKKQLF